MPVLCLGWYRFLSMSIVVFCLSIMLAGCGGGGDGGNGGTPSNTTREVTVTLTDPPTCQVPSGPYTNVWVTITKVRVHTSSQAGPDDGGWVDVVDRTGDPMQVDLFALSSADNACLFATLGSSTGLPPGRIQQIRLHLLSNNPGPNEAIPEPNACDNGNGSNGYNCAVYDDGSIETLNLSSQAKTGIKIPSGQIAGGGIDLMAGQATDINIDFNACRSIVEQGNGGLRLKPTLHAGEVSLSNEAISGTVVDAITEQPIPDINLFVLAEQPDTDNIDRVIQQTLASDTNGTFIMCPMPVGNYDVVVAGVSDDNTAYGPTVTLDVPAGTDMGNIPVLRAAPDGQDVSPGEIVGLVSATADGTGADADITLSTLQDVTVASGTRLVTIPLFDGSTPNVATDDMADCPPEIVGANCVSYNLVVPPSNSLVATFEPVGTPYPDAPAIDPALYRVNAQAFIPDSGGEVNCSPSSLTTPADLTMPSGLMVTDGSMTTAQPLDFTGCQ
jgi:hypothetical protein